MRAEKVAQFNVTAKDHKFKEIGVQTEPDYDSTCLLDEYHCHQINCLFDSLRTSIEKLNVFEKEDTGSDLIKLEVC